MEKIKIEDPDGESTVQIEYEPGSDTASMVEYITGETLFRVSIDPDQAEAQIAFLVEKALILCATRPQGAQKLWERLLCDLQHRAKWEKFVFCGEKDENGRAVNLIEYLTAYGEHIKATAIERKERLAERDREIEEFNKTYVWED